MFGEGFAFVIARKKAPAFRITCKCNYFSERGRVLPLSSKLLLLKSKVLPPESKVLLLMSKVLLSMSKVLPLSGKVLLLMSKVLLSPSKRLLPVSKHLRLYSINCVRKREIGLFTRQKQYFCCRYLSNTQV